MQLLTLGHSKHSFTDFLLLINKYGVKVVLDVRSAPYSRYRPHFNEDSLEFELPRHNISYHFAGQFLGDRPTDPELYMCRKLPAGEVNYLYEVDYQEIM